MPLVDVPPNLVELFGKDRIDSISEDVLQVAVAGARRAGNDAYKAGDYDRALEMYNQAIAGATADKALYSNRAAVLIALGRAEDAVSDAIQCVTLDGQWPKGFFRLGTALVECERYREAIEAFRTGLNLDPSSRELGESLAAAEAGSAAAASAAVVQQRAARRDLVARLRDARRADSRESLLVQLRQSMSGPTWEIEDYEWRPTYLPEMRGVPVDRAAWESGADAGRRRFLRGFVNQLAELDSPKRAIRLFEDAPRTTAYACALDAAAVHHPGAHVLVLPAGGGLLQLLAGRAWGGSPGARVTSVERNRLLHRLAGQVRDANKDVKGLAPISAMDRALEACWAEGDEPPPAVLADRLLVAEALKAAAAANGPDALLPIAPLLGPSTHARASVLVTDLLDFDVLGLGLLPALDHAAKHLLAPNAVVFPARVAIFAALVEARVGTVSGLDLSALNSYRWHPRAERVELAHAPMMRLLSSPMRALTIDLQARVAAVQSAAFTANSIPGGWEDDLELEMVASTDGTWNAIAFWFELDLGGGVTLATGGASVPAIVRAESWGQALQYLDEMPVRAGELVPVRVRRDSAQILFDSVPSAARCRQSRIPRWHYDMLADGARNTAYEAAVSLAISTVRAAVPGRVSVLDIGAGSGILSMLAARAGADHVVGVEISSHMADAGEECEIMNGYAGRCMMLNRDVRRVMAVDSPGVVRGRKPDGNLPELDGRADILLYEVFDSGLIGEGALHLVALAQHRLLREGAAIVPCCARVFAQPLELRLGPAAAACGFDLRPAGSYRWRPDYEGMDLSRLPEGSWRPLADPRQVMAFDFTRAEQHLTPASAPVDFAVNASGGGVLTAVAFWFDLQLDASGAHVLSTSPYDAANGRTWQQAVQWVEELRFTEGQLLPLVCSHDTFGISFAVDDVRLPTGREGMATGTPLCDPLWKQLFDRCAAINKEFAKSCAQNPLEFRAMAMAATELAARPADLGADPEQASEMVCRLFG